MQTEDADDLGDRKAGHRFLFRVLRPLSLVAIGVRHGGTHRIDDLDLTTTPLPAGACLHRFIEAEIPAKAKEYTLEATGRAPDNRHLYSG